MKKGSAKEGADRLHIRSSSVPWAAGLLRRKALFVHNHIMRYVFSVLMVGASILLRYALAPLLGFGYQTVTVYPVMILVAILAGKWPAVLNALISSVVLAYLFSDPEAVGVPWGTVLVILTAFLAGRLVERLHEALERIQRDADALAQSELRFRAIMAATSDAVYRMNADWSEMRQLSGGGFIDNTQAPDREWLTKYIHPDEQSQVLEKIHEAIDKKNKFEMEHRVLRLDGSFGWTYSCAVPLLNDVGQITEWFGIARDITHSKEAEEALRESEQRFKTLADNISQLAWMADDKGQFFWFNKRAYEYTGAVLTSLQGSGWKRMVHPSQLKPLMEKSDECVRTGTFFEDTILVRGKDGDYRWFLCRSTPIHNVQGRVIRWFGTATDIHDLKQTQQALQESEEKFRMLAENAGAIIGIMQDQKIIYANPYSEIASGYTRQELYEIDIPKLIHPDYQKKMMERAQRRQAGEPIESHYEFIMVRKDGQYRWLDFSPIMIYYRGKPAIIGMAFDITERKHAEEALRESEETFRLLAENARAIIGIVQEERFIYANPYLEELSGYTRDEILKMYIGQLVHPVSRAQVLDRARRRQAGEQVESHYEFAMRTKSGQKRWLDFSVTAIHYHGKPAIVGIAIDITDRKVIEDDLQNYKNQLESKNKELESIIGIVSHDLRAPLVNIQGFSQEVKTDCRTVDTILAEVGVEQKVAKQLENLLHHDIPESLQYIETSSEAMNNLVVTLVEVARSGLLPLKPEKIDMNALLKKVTNSLESQIKKNRISYDIQDMPNCVADITQVEQIFRNLLDNAIKYLDPNRPGQICVGGTLQAGSALYWIADNGIGISPEHQEKIFEPYYQLKEKASGGIGMGLVTVKRMVEHNGGKIWVVSEKGKYSTFYVALPSSNH